MAQNADTMNQMEREDTVLILEKVPRTLGIYLQSFNRSWYQTNQAQWVMEPPIADQIREAEREVDRLLFQIKKEMKFGMGGVEVPTQTILQMTETAKVTLKQIRPGTTQAEKQQIKSAKNVIKNWNPGVKVMIVALVQKEIHKQQSLICNHGLPYVLRQWDIMEQIIILLPARISFPGMIRLHQPLSKIGMQILVEHSLEEYNNRHPIYSIQLTPHPTVETGLTTIIGEGNDSSRLQETPAMNNEILDHIPLNIIVWNIRGGNNSRVIEEIVDLKLKMNVKIVVLLETKMSQMEAKGTMPLFGFTGYLCAPTENYTGSMIMLWDKNDVAVAGAIIEPGVIQAVISLRRHVTAHPRPSILGAVYADTHRDKRQRVFANIRDTAEVEGDYIVAGDFNTMLDPADKEGGARVNARNLEELQNLSTSAGLQRLDPTGDTFTWTNRRQGESLIKERLDQVFINESWSQHYTHTQVPFVRFGRSSPLGHTST